jgi:hypothetical protein
MRVKRIHTIAAPERGSVIFDKNAEIVAPGVVAKCPGTIVRQNILDHAGRAPRLRWARFFPFPE